MDTLVAEVPREVHPMPILATLAAFSPASVPILAGVGLSFIAGSVQAEGTISETIPNTIVGVALVTVVILFLKAFKESEQARLLDAQSKRADHAAQLKAQQEVFAKALEVHVNTFAAVMREQFAASSQIGGSLRELAAATASAARTVENLRGTTPQ